MVKPNYQFEKRQRDLAKKSKQEEKRRQKLAAKTSGTSHDGTLASEVQADTAAGDDDTSLAT